MSIPQTFCTISCVMTQIKENYENLLAMYLTLMKKVELVRQFSGHRL